MAEKIEVGVVVKGADTASKQIDGIDKATKSLGTGVEGAAMALDKMTGGAVTGFRKAAMGTKAFIKGLKLTRVALISTGIGAIVVAVGALVGFFLKTNKGAKMLKVGLAALGAIVERVTGYFQAMGAFIVGLFSGGVTEAVSAYNDEMAKLPGTMQDAINKAMELERRTQALAGSQRNLTVLFAKGRAEIKEYNMIAEDTTKTLEEREAAAKKAIDIEQVLMAERQRIAKEELDIAREKASLSDSSEEDLDNLAQLEANYINIRTESAEMQTTLNNKLNALRQQAIAAAKAEAAEIKAAEDKKIAKYKEAQRAKEEELKGILSAQEEAASLFLSQQEKELMAFDNHWDDMMEAQGDYIDFIAEHETEFRQGELERQEAHYEAMADLYEEERVKFIQDQQQKQLQDLTTYLKSEQQIELEEFQLKHDALMEAALEAGIETNQLEEQLAAEKQAIIDKYGEAERQTAEATAAAWASAREQIYQNFMSSLSVINQGREQDNMRAAIQRRNDKIDRAKTEDEILSIEEQFQYEQAKIQHKAAEQARKLAIVAILIEQGKAIASAIAGATAAGAATGPGAVVSTPLFIAQLVGIVLGGFAQIKSVMNQAGAEMPEMPAPPDLSGDGGGAAEGASESFDPSNPQLALTPDLAQSFNQALGSQAIQAYVVQQEIADADALAATLQNQASLGGG